MTADAEVNRVRNGTPSKRFVCLALGATVLAALFVRLYRIDQQSLWMDEIAGVIHRTAPDLWTYLALIQNVAPEQIAAPLYYVFEYFWGQWVSMSQLSLRVVTVLLGTTAVPLIYVLGAYTFGRRAGLIAALCLALSPQHVWHAQEVRCYTLVTPLAIVSVYALLRACRERRMRWWLVHFAVNLLLLWSHLFTVFVFAVEGVVLLLFFRTPFRRVIAWGCIQFVLTIPSILFLLATPYIHDFPPIDDTVRDIFFNGVVADDIVDLHTDLLPAWKTNPPNLIPEIEAALLPVRTAFDWALIAVFCAAPVWLCGRTVRAALRKRRGLPTSEEAQDGTLLLLLFLVPAVTAGLLHMVTHKPFACPMYTMYNTVGLYVAIGVMISALRRPVLQSTAALALALLYGYQLAIFLPGVTRIDYRAGVNQVRAEGSPHDLVLSLVDFYAEATPQYYLQGSGIPCREVRSYQAACDAAADFLGQQDAAANVPDSRKVWIFIKQLPITWLAPDFDSARAIQDGIAARGLAATSTVFPGHYNLILLRITKPSAAPPGLSPGPVASAVPVDWESLLREIGLSYAEDTQREDAIRALRKEIPFWPALGKLFYMQHSLGLLEQGRADMAEALARWTIQRYPQFGMAHFALGCALAAQGNCDDANSAFQTSFHLHRGLHRLFGPFVTALCETSNESTAQAELTKLESMGLVWGPYAPALRAACKARFR